MSEAPATTSWRVSLPHSTAAVPIARALIRKALAEIQPSADSDTAELLTAELVANAVEHTEGDDPIQLVVDLLEQRCQVEVHDRSRATPPSLVGELPPEPPDVWAEGGRGLLLIRTLSLSCGHRPTETGKAIWFTLPTADRPDGARPGPR
ncbi:MULTISPECIES: ATP-binding protein [Streptomyces]|uniref:ATP-binding protein n=1 Tax=Streptomyces albidoflavus TaxID=1886 RepID=A0ABY3H233_9ACTN|nr:MULTISPECIES: ATP-binding protein [Streptomyces]MYX51330.1 ATP-binding protein [Streptomyces sp. SID8385]BDH49826.1 ATP-binding protein [Streptomyces albus]AGI87215.1 Regulatory protein [Streptomyces albidoflavus]EFE84667.1 regulatory protein [Streptomyces albidoflavus]MBV7251764.1 ATP-binding protein [Streptomyces sp. S-2]